MADAPGAPAFPLEIDLVQCSPLGRDKVIVRLEGHWVGRRRGADGRPLLVVEADGRRHRFPGYPEPRRARIGRMSTWGASFALPSWLMPSLSGDLSLWLGNVAIPLPPARFEDVEPDEDGPAETQREPRRPRRTVPAPAAGPDEPAVAPVEDVAEGYAAAEDHGSDPQAADPDLDPDPVPDTSHRDSHDDSKLEIAALRAELEERAAKQAHLRGELARAQAELKARPALSAEVEAAHAELRTELERLRKLVERETQQRKEIESRAVVLAASVADLQQQLDDAGAERERAANELAGLRARAAELAVARDAAHGEAAALRAEIERLGAELATSQARTGARDPELAEAENLLAEARALTSRLAGGRPRPSGSS